MDASHVYVRALPLGCFYSHISTRTFRRALTASLDSGGDKECPLSGVTKSCRVWRKVPESGARSVPWTQTPSTGLRHPSFNHCRIYGYAIGSRKLSANEQFFLFLFVFVCSDSSKFVTNNSDYITRLFYN